MQLCRAQGAELILCGIDLNGRLPGGVGVATGPPVCGEPDAIGKRFAQILVKMRMWVPSTFRHLHPGEDCTYVHPTGSEHRIDFIAGAAMCLQAQSEVHVNFDTGAPREDRRLVGLWVGGLFREVRQRASLWRPKYDRDKILSDEGRAIIAEACANFTQPSWEVMPDEHYLLIQNMLLTTLQQNFQVADTPAHASYIPAEVWDIREAKISLKRASRGRARLRSDLIPCAFRQWREGLDRGLLRLIGKQGFLYNLAAAAIRFAAARVRKGIAAARQNFLSKILAEGHQSAAQVLRRAKAAGLGGARARWSKRPLPALLHPTSGQPVGGKAGYDQVWLEHFGHQEQGHIVATDQLTQQAAVPMPVDEEAAMPQRARDSVPSLRYRRDNVTPAGAFVSWKATMLKAAASSCSSM